MVYRLSRPVPSSQLARELGLQLHGADKEILSIAQLDSAEAGSLTFAKSWPQQTVAGAIYVATAPSGEGMVTCLSTAHPRLDFIRALHFLEKLGVLSPRSQIPVIHPTVRIGANVVIEDNCVIEQGVVIEPNVVIMWGTRIGSFSRIRANSTIGSDGFGFERVDNGTVLRFPHLGGVSIGSYVEVGANTCISRGTLGDTVICDEVKIDNLVHIAHNVRIERQAFVIACAELSGGCVVEEGAWIGPNASVKEHAVIGRHTLIGIGANVLRSVPPNAVYAGNPARPLPTKQVG